MSPVLYHDGAFPPKTFDWPRLLPLIGPANAAIARYAGLLEGIPNPDVLLSPMTMQEAVLSSRIEGTQATMGEVLEVEAEGGPIDESTPKKADIREVLNYRAALREATRLMDILPLSQKLVRQTHRVLMQGVRGRSKDPGEYRRIPNWIGPEGCTIDQARFIPTSAEKIPAAMTAWENYLHVEAPDILIQLAVIHAEFEAVHPFLDGNGRLGRLIVPLFLFNRGLLARPCFYLSEYLDGHRDEYYAALLAVSRIGDWTGWCAFFLRALTEQAKSNQQRVQAILDLYNMRKGWIAAETHSQYAVRALDWMFERPIFQASEFRDAAGIPAPTAARILRVCRDNGLLRELRAGAGRRSAIFCFPELLNIAEGRDVF
ncbi:Fic family protein [Zavarzinia compransoris]|uniref:Fic family protein n=1 Tax=Zavarzinia marina TaxID=2911065 RepID=UPI001F30082F|nr:Fic/DOC family N-terminal domain-containing protein [Zavarzinia marina]MCF4166915.1 Fic family protein [Zavarzinia marina]